ncbi:type II toxin-antitoxin system VapC family toxin [Thiohalophilus sp.]|uniref:type II toxin-antitoxin system VapC family toxin n=1 Tax=Thiohalophilus sp. TaxID=3028392 RepID=UPI002ACDF351|nr:type II toxin-antitoxin system VapC family toxin [Thiohalophilus sp.]MDZ7662778.1 type II toxin-antitoxin system VapC family toxin [Thiohalophilus sp.]
MILYCDTSALVKLYVVEPHSETLKALLDQARAVAVSRIAWAEYHAALARRAREVPGDAAALDRARHRLADEWGHYLVMEVTQAVVEKAGEYAEAFALRGYDAVQLASAHEAMTQTDLPVTFACFDRRLNQAAKLLAMKSWQFAAGSEQL